jgi:hypothetical protein
MLDALQRPDIGPSQGVSLEPGGSGPGRGRLSQNWRRRGARTTVNFLPTDASLLPHYGGPAFSVSRLVMATAEVGAEVVKIEPGRSKARLERVDESVTHFG